MNEMKPKEAQHEVGRKTPVPVRVHIIGLDVDGVLTTRDSAPRLDHGCVTRFNATLDDIRAEGVLPWIVLTSTWRLYPRLANDLKHVVFWREATPEIEGAPRWEEIRAYLAKSSTKRRLDQSARISVIDDSDDAAPPDMYVEGLDQPVKFIKTGYAEGFNEDSAKELLRWAIGLD